MGLCVDVEVGSLRTFSCITISVPHLLHMPYKISKESFYFSSIPTFLFSKPRMYYNLSKSRKPILKIPDIFIIFYTSKGNTT